MGQITLQGVQKSFGPVHIIKGADLDIADDLRRWCHKRVFGNLGHRALESEYKLKQVVHRFQPCAASLQLPFK